MVCRHQPFLHRCQRVDAGLVGLKSQIDIERGNTSLDERILIGTHKASFIRKVIGTNLKTCVPGSSLGDLAEGRVLLAQCGDVLHWKEKSATIHIYVCDD